MQPVDADNHPARHLEAWRWKKGQTGNPKGKPKGIRDVTAERQYLTPHIRPAIVKLAKLVESKDERVATEAIRLLFAYTFGQPHADAGVKPQNLGVKIVLNTNGRGVLVKSDTSPPPSAPASISPGGAALLPEGETA